MTPEKREPDPKCSLCYGTGWRRVLPAGLNPFLMSIDAIAHNSRRIECDCVRRPRD